MTLLSSCPLPLCLSFLFLAFHIVLITSDLVNLFHSYLSCFLSPSTCLCIKYLFLFSFLACPNHPSLSLHHSLHPWLAHWCLCVFFFRVGMFSAEHCSLWKVWCDAFMGVLPPSLLLLLLLQSLRNTQQSAQTALGKRHRWIWRMKEKERREKRNETRVIMR